MQEHTACLHSSLAQPNGAGFVQLMEGLRHSGHRAVLPRAAGLGAWPGSPHHWSSPRRRQPQRRRQPCSAELQPAQAGRAAPRAGSQDAPSLGHSAGNNPPSPGLFSVVPSPRSFRHGCQRGSLRDHLSLIFLEPGKSGEIQRKEALKSLRPWL